MTLAQMCQLSDINRRSLTINVNRPPLIQGNDQARVSAAQLLGPDLQRDNPALQRDHPRRHQTASTSSQNRYALTGPRPEAFRQSAN
jgi:hypothetical protein